METNTSFGALIPINMKELSIVCAISTKRRKRLHITINFVFINYALPESDLLCCTFELFVGRMKRKKPFLNERTKTCTKL